jgi:uncharacterized protein
MQTIRIGLISDTHNLLRARALEALQGSAQIIHAGDICQPDVLDQLAAIAPVTAVRGNNDVGPWAMRLPATALLRIGEISILAVHDLATFDSDPTASGARVVVSGHSHRPLVREQRGVLYVNPGSAGPQRFRLPISVAELLIHEGSVEANLLELSLG